MTFLEETWLDKTHIDSEIKRLKWTQYEPIKIEIRTQIPKNKNSNTKYQESYTKLKWDFQAQIEQKPPIELNRKAFKSY